MEIFDLPPMLKGNEQDLPNLRNYLIRLGDEIKRIQNDVSTIESIEQIVKNAEKAIEYTEQAIKTKQNILTFDSVPTAGSNNPVKSDGIKTELAKYLLKAGGTMTGAVSLYKDSTVSASPASGDNSTKVATTAWVKSLVEKEKKYQNGEKVSLQGGIYAGFLSSSQKAIYFFVPLQKDLSEIASATLTDVSWQIRHVGGGYLANNVKLASICQTITCNKYPSGIRVAAVSSTALSATNNTPLVVSSAGANIITLSS